MRIALAQINPTVGDIAANAAKHARFIEDARSAGASVVVFPELSITGYPPNSQIGKTALGAEARVKWDHAYDAKEVLRDLKKAGYQIILVEQTDKSMSYHEFIPNGPVCLVMGNEIEGVSEELVGLSDASVEIEMAGLKNSLNVGVAFGIVAYHLRNCLKKS